MKKNFTKHLQIIMRKISPTHGQCNRVQQYPRSPINMSVVSKSCVVPRPFILLASYDVRPRETISIFCPMFAISGRPSSLPVHFCGYADCTWQNRAHITRVPQIYRKSICFIFLVLCK